MIKHRKEIEAYLLNLKKFFSKLKLSLVWNLKNFLVSKTNYNSNKLKLLTISSLVLLVSIVLSGIVTKNTKTDNNSIETVNVDYPKDSDIDSLPVPDDESLAATEPSITPKISEKISATPTPSTSAGSTGNQAATNNNTNNQPTSSPTQGAIPTLTPTPTPTPSIATVSISSLTLTMNRGETKSNLFTITSNGATSLSTIVSLSPTISGLNYSPASAGMTNGSVKNFSLSVPSSANTGTYSGYIRFTFQPGNVEKYVNLNLTVVDPPASSMGFTFSTDTVSVTIPHDGAQHNVFSFTSTGSTSFSFSVNYSNPPSGVVNYLASGGISPGQTSNMFFQVYSGVAVGTYTGTGTFRDGTTGAEKVFPIQITVID